MKIVLSVVNFSAVAYRNDNDRGVFLDEDHAPISDPKAATTAALKPFHIGRSISSVDRKFGVDPFANVSRQFNPLPGRRGSEGDLLHRQISHIAIFHVNQKYRLPLLFKDGDFAHTDIVVAVLAEYL
jgi:hypothetical protein